MNQVLWNLTTNLRDGLQDKQSNGWESSDSFNKRADDVVLRE